MSWRASITADTATGWSASHARGHHRAGWPLALTAGSAGATMQHGFCPRTAARPEGRPGLPVLPHQGRDRDAVPAARPGRPERRSCARSGVEAQVFDCTFSILRAPAPTTWPPTGPAIVGISSMVSLTGNALRVAAAVRERLPGSPARRRRPAAHRLPGPLPAARRRSSFRGEADLSFPRFCRDYFGAAARRRRPRRPAARVVRRPVRRRRRPCAWTTPCAPHAERARRLSPARPQRLRPRRLPDASGRRRPAIGRPRCSPRSAAPTAASSAPSRSSATSCAAAPLDAVFAEIDGIVRLGYDGLWIADDTFTLRPRLPGGVLPAHRAAGAHVELPLARQRDRRPPTARLMQEAGCRRVYLGLESGSQATLDLMNKRMTVEQGARAATVYREAGIEVAAFFIVGYPGETVRPTSSRPSPWPSPCRWTRSPSTYPCRCRGRGCSSAWAGTTRAGLDAGERGHLRLPARTIDEAWLRRRIDETMAAFAAQEAPRGGERPAARAPRQAAARRKSARRSGPSTERRAAGAKRPSRRLISNSARPLRSAKRILSGREVAVVGAAPG